MKKRIFAGLLACLLMIHTFLPINGYGAYENFSEIEFTDGSGPSITQDSPFTDGFESPDSFSEEADKTAEAALNSETAAVFFNENMSVEELKTLDDTTAGAALEYTAPSLMSVPLLKPLNASQSWNFNVYYVNQPNDYHVTKTDDFNLKYQYEFHTDTNLEANAVAIRN